MGHGLHAASARAPRARRPERRRTWCPDTSPTFLVGGKKFLASTSSSRPIDHSARGALVQARFARFCNVKYEDVDGNVYAHLTNAAIQKRGEEYNAARNKWSLATAAVPGEHGGREATDELFADINDAIEHLRSVQNVIINDRRCFELTDTTCTSP